MSDATAGEPKAERTALLDLIRHMLVYGSGYVTMAVASFVLVPVYTRQLSPSGYGVLGLMLVLYGLMSQFYDLGFTNSVGRFFFDRDPEDPEGGLLKMRTTAVVFLASLGGALTLLLWVFAGPVSSLLTQTSTHANLVRIVALTLYAEALAIVPLTLIRMQERSRLFVTITVARFVLTLGCSIVLVVVLKWGVRGALIANAVSAVGVLLVLLPDYRHLTRARPSAPLLRDMLSFALPYFPVLVSAWFIEASDRYLLGEFRTHAEVGYYVLGYKVAQVMQIGVAAFSMGWAPLRFRIYEQPGAQETYRRLTTYYVLASSMLVVLLGVMGQVIVAVVAPASYSPAANIVPLIAFAYALNGLYQLVVTGMGVAKKTAPMAWVVGIAATVNIGLNLILIPRWGIEAAAATTVLSNAMMVYGGWYYSQKVYPIPYDWSRMIKTTIIGAVVVSLAVLVAPGHGLGAALVGLAAWVVFAVLLVKTSTINASEVAAARGLIRKLLARTRTAPEPV